MAFTEEQVREMGWTPDEATSRMIWRYALQNAFQYDGKGKAGSIMGRIMAERVDLRPHGKEMGGILAKAVNEANELAQKEGLAHIQKLLEVEAPKMLEKKSGEREVGLPPLPNAKKGEVVLRFAPNPNGPLSLGHTRGVVINSEYAKMLDGEMILRFDDTDTGKKRAHPEGYRWIQEDYERLVGKKPDRIIIASERMDVYLEHAQKLLDMGGGYICTCHPEEFSKLRREGVACPCREQRVEDALSGWDMMLNGGYEPGDAVLRIRTDLSFKNPALRDWPAWRIQTNPHPRKVIGDKYRVWPLLDFQSAIEDHLQGVTHIIRGQDLMDSTRKQNWLYNLFDWAYPEVLYWGRVKVHGLEKFSTSQMSSDIEGGVYSDWDDLRLPTLRSLTRKGFQTEAIRSFWIELGLNRKDISVPLSLLESHNSKLVDGKAPRLTFVREPVTITLTSPNDSPHPAKANPPLHPEHPEWGNRELKLNWVDGKCKVLVESEDINVGAKARLKDLANIEFTNDNSAILISEEKTGKYPPLHWLPADENDSISASLHMLENGEVKVIVGEIEHSEIKVGTIVQLERIGFAIIENISERKAELAFLH